MQNGPKPHRLDINQLAMKDSIVRAALKLYDRHDLTYEEALIFMVKLLVTDGDRLRHTVKILQAHSIAAPVQVYKTEEPNET